MSTDGPGIDRAREQLARRDANAEDAPDPPDPKIDEQERAVRDERGREDRD